MLIQHISDTHGKLLTINSNCDIVVHSGDFLPDMNSRFNNRDLTIENFQSQWLHSVSKKLKGALRNKPFLFCGGNHDFLHGNEIEKILKAYDIDAYCLNDKIIEINNVKFYGFPYIPYIFGNFNYEADAETLRNKTLNMCKDINNKYLDVLVCHAPPYRILDKAQDGVNYGNPYLINHFENTLNAHDRPKWIMCGHIHSSNGINTEWICNVSNAATVSHNIEIH